MDDCKEIQLQEIEALESIYASDVNVISRDYPTVCVEVSTAVEHVIYSTYQYYFVAPN